MNVVRLTYNLSRLSATLRHTPSGCPSTLVSRGTHQRATKKVPQKTVEEAPRKPINQKIPLQVVQVVDADGKLEPPQPLTDLLARVNLKEFYVELVAPDKSIVKIYNKKVERAKAKERSKAMKVNMRAMEQKEIQMTWGVARGDMAHKLEKARRNLEKQTRVNLVFAPKSKQPLPPPEERNVKVAEVLELLKDVGTEWLPRTFRRSLLTIYLRSLNQ